MAVIPVAQVHEEFRIAYDNIASSFAPEVTPEQIDIFLNKAQANLITWCKKKGFESTQTIKDYLANIKVNANLTPFFQTTDNQPNGYFIEFPDNYRTLVKSETTVTYVDCHDEDKTKRIKDKPITEDIYNNIINDPFRKPNINSQDEFTISMEYEKINNKGIYEVITDGTFTPSIYHIRYIRDPQQIQYGSQYLPISTIDQDCELNEEAGRRIIEDAVDLAKLAVQAPSYQINQERTLIENN